MNPATMRGQRLDADTYICFFTVGAVESAFRINPENPQGVVFIDQGAFGSFYDTISDKLYLLDAGNVVKKWDSGAPMTVSYKTGVTRWRQECCPGAMKIESKVYPVAFQLFADGVLIHSRSVTSKEPFRLPSGYMAQQFQRSYSVAGAMTFGLLAEEIGDLAQ